MLCHTRVIKDEPLKSSGPRQDSSTVCVQNRNYCKISCTKWNQSINQSIKYLTCCQKLARSQFLLPRELNSKNKEIFALRETQLRLTQLTAIRSTTVGWPAPLTTSAFNRISQYASSLHNRAYTEAPALCPPTCKLLPTPLLLSSEF